jgi:hypothetical protein
MLLSIDPGLRMCGASLWLDGKLHRAWLVKGLPIRKDRSYPNAWKVMAENVCKEVGGLALELVIEFPISYPQKHLQKGDQNDLIQLGAAVGAIVDKLSLPTTMIYPRDWKKQLPKDVCAKRIDSRLSEEEKRAIELPKAKSYHHNLIDGIGIGLHHLKRYLF